MRIKVLEKLKEVKNRRLEERIEAIKISVWLVRRIRDDEVIEEILGYPEYIQECLSSFQFRYKDALEELSKKLKRLRWVFSKGMQFNESESAIRFFVLLLLLRKEPKHFFKNKQEFLKNLQAEGFFELACYLEYHKMSTLSIDIISKYIVEKYWDTYPRR